MLVMAEAETERDRHGRHRCEADEHSDDQAVSQRVANSAECGTRHGKQGRGEDAARRRLSQVAGVSVEQ